MHACVDVSTDMRACVRARVRSSCVCMQLTRRCACIRVCTCTRMCHAFMCVHAAYACVRAFMFARAVTPTFSPVHIAQSRRQHVSAHVSMYVLHMGWPHSSTCVATHAFLRMHVAVASHVCLGLHVIASAGQGQGLADGGVREFDAMQEGLFQRYCTCCGRSQRRSSW